jgi:hypothetical protein
MINHQVIVSTISIQKQGEVKHFVINLPRDTKSITGVQYSERSIDVPEYLVGICDITIYKRNQVLGLLSLQSSERANWFYSTSVMSGDRNLNQLDFSNEGFWTLPYTHQQKRLVDPVQVKAVSPFIKGLFTDTIGKINGQDLHYEVKVYLWIKTEE